MYLRRPASLVSCLVTAALAVLGAAPAARADQVREMQWPLTAFRASDRVWPHSTGKGVVVTVIDQGVRASHVDLTGQVLPGRDFTVPGGGNGWTDHAPNCHGTAMASIIAGHGHGPGGADGVKGLAPDARILPLTVSLDSWVSGQRQIAKAIRYATDHGAKVINMSFGGAAASAEERSAVAYAEAHGVVLVAAAGNDGIDFTQSPAALPRVIAVAAVDKQGHAWAKSNYGSGIVLSAPDQGIVSATAGNGHQYFEGDGTSEATAYVSAAAALVRSAYPKLTAGQVVKRLVRSAANPDGTGRRTDRYGYGIIRPDGALTMNIPAGPAAGPLPQATPASASPVEATPSAAAAASPRRTNWPRTAAVLVAAGALLLLATGAGAAVAVRRRSTSAR